MGFRLPRVVISYISNSDVIHRQETIERNVNVHFLNDAIDNSLNKLICEQT